MPTPTELPCRKRTCTWRVVLGWLVAALLFSAPAAAAFDFNDEAWEGTSNLLEIARDELGSHRVELVATLDWSELQPADGVLILHPTVAIEYAEASAFLRAGGRLAVLDDHGKAPSLLERFHIRRVPAPLQPAHTLRENNNLALAQPAVQQIAGFEQGRHPVVANVDLLATNHPTALEHPELTEVLRIEALGERAEALAITGIITDRERGTAGRLFAMGDPSALINHMLRYGGNKAFAKGLVQYLVEDDSWGARGGRLFLLSNDFRQTGHYGGGTTLGRELRAQLDGFAELVDDARTHGLPDLLAALLAALVALGAVAWMATIALRTYKRLGPRFARETPLLALGGVAGRAAVLAAPTTHKALALVELKSALEEGLALRLGLSGRPAPSTLRTEINRQEALSRRSSQHLESMMNQLAQAETAVVASQPMRVTANMVEAMRQDVRNIFEEVDERLGEKRE